MTIDDRQAIALLGLTGAPMSSIEMVPTLRKGLPSKTLEAVSKQLGLTPMATGALLGIPARTLSRRLASRRKLTPEESQRVYRLSRVVILATRALGNIEKARHWLQTSNRVLGDEVPLHLLDTDVGTEAVIEELGRIEYGVFA